jgi:hypothetical protein
MNTQPTRTINLQQHLLLQVAKLLVQAGVAGTHLLERLDNGAILKRLGHVEHVLLQRLLDLLHTKRALSECLDTRRLATRVS